MSVGEAWKEHHGDGLRTKCSDLACINYHTPGSVPHAFYVGFLAGNKKVPKNE